MAQLPQSLHDLFLSLRASYNVYRNAHWQVQGPNYYGNHLLFQRLYEETEKQIDAMAEQIVGTYGSSALDDTADEIDDFVKSFEIHGEGTPLGNSLEAARSVRAYIDDAYADLERRDKLTLGWDEMLMNLAREKDQHLYLLQQASKPSKLKAKLLR